MNTLFLLSFGGMFMLMLVGSGLMMLRQSRHQERFAARVRMIHGQAPAQRRRGGAGGDQGRRACGRSRRLAR